MHDPVSEHASPSKAIVVEQAATSDDSSGIRHALLAIIVDVPIVAFGGGGIQTARGYWERVSSRAEMKASEIRQQANPEAARQRGEEVVGIPELEQELPPKPTG